MPSRFAVAGSACALFAVFAVGCAATKPPAPSHVPAVQPRTAAPQIVPLKRGEMPDGWRLNSLVGTVIQFAKEDSDAVIQFHVFSSEVWTAESVIRRLADQGASKPGVTVSDITVAKSGDEAGLRVRDDRIGQKLGRAVARTFPGRSSLGIMVIGLWPADRNAEHERDFDKFLDWVRLD